MKTGSPLVGVLSRLGSPPLNSACDHSDAQPALAWQDEWPRASAASLMQHGTDDETGESVLTLAALVKADLRCRFSRGERPAVADYLDRFPRLRAEHDRVVSLVYEEYCLREEQGEPLDPERFCARYEPWRDSLASQLRYHRLLSQVVAPPAAPPRFPEPGESFHGFQLRTELGRGGVARVYLATEADVGNREVALKVSADRGKEPSIQGRLDHGHIVPVLSVTPRDPETGLRGMCMPYRAGASLDDVIRWIDPASRPRRARVLWDALASQSRTEWEKGPTGPGWLGFPSKGTYAEGVAWVVLTLARALDHAHSQGVLHRDVKPANVLLTFREGPQLLDFNLAHDPNDAEQAEAALRGGTLPYMAPEQLEAFLDPASWNRVGETADLYALGLLMSELLTGQRPEPPDPTLALPRAIRELLDRRAAPHPSLRTSNPTIPHSLDSIAARCLAYSSSERYPSARALVEDIERFLEHRCLQHAPNTSKAEVARNWTLRNRVRIAVVLALLAIPPMSRVVFQKDRTPAAGYSRMGMDLVIDKQWDRAREFFERAQQIDRNFYQVYFGLARIAAAQKEDFEEAYSDLSEAIRLAESTTPKPRAEEIAWMYQSRAAASWRLGRNIQRSLSPEAFLKASPHYTAVLGDVARARQIGKYPDITVLFNMEYDSAGAEIGLGDVDSCFDRYEESVAHYQKASEYLDEAFKLRPRNDIEAPLLKRLVPDAQTLRKDLDMRLAVDTPKRDLARRSSAGQAEVTQAQATAKPIPAAARQVSLDTSSTPFRPLGQGASVTARVSDN